MIDEDEPEPVIETNVGWAGVGKNYFRGYSVAEELADRHGFWTLISLATGHRPLEPQEAELLDRLAIAANGSDPRIWPLKFAWLVGSYGGSMAALGALLVWLDGSMVGPSPAHEAGKAWIELGTLEGTEAIAQWFVERKARGEHVQGFGVPGRSQDERVELGKRLIESYQHHGRYYRLFVEVEGILRQHGRLRPNIVALVTVCALDLGFQPHQIPFVVWPGLEVSIIANALEASIKRPEVLHRMPSRRVRYDGPLPRASPRALATK
jgi:hypothetical protein